MNISNNDTENNFRALDSWLFGTFFCLKGSLINCGELQSWEQYPSRQLDKDLIESKAAVSG